MYIYIPPVFNKLGIFTNGENLTGLHDDTSTKSSSSLNLNGADPWGSCLFAFLEKDRVLTLCPSAVAHSWPIVFTRINSLFSVIDPT